MKRLKAFFEICEKRGLTGEQGVMIPEANVKNLMLNEDVVQAVREGRFHVYPVKTIDEGMELLTGLEMGMRDKDGSYPEGSINALVEGKLKKFASIQQKFAGKNSQPAVDKKELT